MCVCDFCLKMDYPCNFNHTYKVRLDNLGSAIFWGIGRLRRENPYIHLRYSHLDLVGKQLSIFFANQKSVVRMM